MRMDRARLSKARSRALRSARLQGCRFGHDRDSGHAPSALYQIPPRATVIASPFTPPAAALQRKAITSATSRGSSTRFCG